MHVAVNAPASSPRVSEYEEILRIIVANDVHSMVQSNRALSREHTARVLLEVIVSAHSNRHDILLQAGDQSSLGGNQFLVARDILMLILRSAAPRVLCLVRIVRSQILATLLFIVVEASVKVPASAATALPVAVNKLLLREFHHLTVLFNRACRLDRGDGTECPAGAALSLVSNGCNPAFFSPVDAPGLDGLDRQDLYIGLFHRMVSVIVLDLILSEVGKKVDAHIESAVRETVVFVDHSEVLLEDRLSELVLLFVKVLLALFRNELEEKGFLVGNLSLEQRLRGSVLGEHGKASKCSKNANEGERDFTFHRYILFKSGIAHLYIF